MNIVVVDGHTLNPGDLSWERLKEFGDLTVYPRSSEEELLERCEDASIILTNKVPFRKEILSALPDLSYLGVTATGFDIVDMKTAISKSITVTNVPAYGSDSVAQHTFALLLELTNHVGIHASSTASGDWSASPDWSYTKSPLTELAGKTMGLVGLGNIGKKTSEIARAFGMQVIAFKKNMDSDSTDVELVSLHELLAESDVVSLHLPLNETTFHLINEGRLSLMKKTAFLINTARGGLIEEQALAEALNSGKLAGAALDVLSEEPPVINHMLLNAKNCLITPHVAWASRESRARLLNIAILNVQQFLKGNAQNVISK